MKVLIWNKFKLENKGGPVGYLYNLSKFNEIKKKVTFFNKYEEIKKKKVNKLKQLLKKIKILEILNIIKFINTKNSMIVEGIERYSIIHIHQTLDFYKDRELLECNKNIKVLTSHSPQPLSEEIIDGIGLKNKIIKKISYNLIKKIDCYSLFKADYLIFPCKEAMEPYLTRDIKIKKILEKRLIENKVKFLPTGIIDKNIEFQENYFYEKFNIPKNSIVLCYLGRHNEIKGYDLLIKAGKEILEKNKDIYIIVGGQINSNIKPLKHERWIELGWTSEGDNIMKHAHAYLLPNRETYFDLVFIEALRAGTTIICSETGGNKYFKQFDSPEIIYFEKENKIDLIKVVQDNLKKFSDLNYIKNRKENRRIYEENFTIEKFGNNYLKIMEEIYEESK